jgi:branched-chain amino acid aminotransferase
VNKFVVRPSGISPADRGFTLGDGLFETLRVYRGRPFLLDEHLARLRRSAEHLRIGVPSTIGSEIAEVLRAGGEQGTTAGDCALRITLSRGVASGPGLALGLAQNPTVVVSLYALAERDPSLLREGISAVVATSRRNERAATAGHKMLAFGDAVLELAWAQESGAHDCVFLDSQGHVSEASAANVFLFDGEVLATPALSCGVLPGVTRAAIMDLARRLSVDVQERVVEKEELLLAREAFLTSSVREVVPLVQIDGHRLGRGRVGVLTQALAQAYGEMTGRSGSD